MDITSLAFLILLGVLICIYYCLPHRLRWPCLLAASMVFIAACKPMGLLFLLLSAAVIWYGARKIERNFCLNDTDSKVRQKNKGMLTAVIAFNLMILFLLKYVGSYAGTRMGTKNIFALLIPIGLSYYTLQAIGYMLDVYWKKIPAEQSYFKVLLFLSYFPQMLQGPISRYGDLSQELYQKKHDFDFKNIKCGTGLMLWGYLKILVVGDNAALIVDSIFRSGTTPYGMAVFFGLVLFGIQLYCNFGGGIDVVRGISLCFGIQLPENFRQPFFSSSLGEFWRRWHITLGTWMKDYVFFPFSMSHGVSRFKKMAKKHIPKKWANRLPIAAANIVVFLLVGIWHGVGTNYALWGLYNGVILALSGCMTDVYKRTKDHLGIRADSKPWYCFCLIRTFLIVTVGWCTDCAVTAAGSVDLILNMLSFASSNFLLYLDSELMKCLIRGMMGFLPVLTVSIAKERKKNVQQWLNERSVLTQMIFWAMILQIIIVFSCGSGSGGFLYAEF